MKLIASNLKTPAQSRAGSIERRINMDLNKIAKRANKLSADEFNKDALYRAMRAIQGGFIPEVDLKKQPLKEESNAEHKWSPHGRNHN